MRHVYTKVFVIFFLSSATVLFAQGKILRSSLSTSVAGAHDIQMGQYKVQQSVAHMGVIGSVKRDNHIISQGFLLPQEGVSTEKPVLDFDWMVYPNPFDTYVNIDFDAPVTGDMVIRLHDVSGQLIIETEQAAKQQQRLHLGNLSQGEYIISAEVMGRTFSRVLLNYKRKQKED